VIGFTHSEEILGWITNGVDLETYFVPYKGVYRGNFYDSVVPVPAEFPNSKSVDLFHDFVKNTVITRIRNGSVLPWGKVGYCDPPKLVMGLTIEPEKPRLCHDETFLNLWIKDLPFSLDTLLDIQPYLNVDGEGFSVDTPTSRTYLGFKYPGVHVDDEEDW
jgi:hypothetical protein